MKTFKYKRPSDLKEAVVDLTPSLNKSEGNPHGEKARLLGGGTDIIGSLKSRISPSYPDTLVSLSDVELQYIKEDDDYISIGATTTLNAIEKDWIISSKIPLLKEAAQSVASPQIRHQATLAGNICQEPRCWYYRYPENQFHCMRKGGKNCNALTGNNPYHSIFGAAKVIKSPCEIGCPNGTKIPLYFDHIRKGEIDLAAEIFMSANPMGSVTGRVCPHECQTHCNRNEFDDTVAIRNVERFIGDYALKHMDKLIDKEDKISGKKIAIIGAGPAGMTAAYYLALKGHRVKVYDKNDKPGGMLRYTIPSYRLPKKIVDDIVRVLEEIGVEFVLGSDVDPNKTPSAYKKDNDSVLIACGAWGDNELKFEGAEHALSGLKFLYDVSQHKIDKPGDKVVVIGGGNVALDVAVTAKRMGSDVTILYRRTIGEMPANDWEIDEALKEGIKIKESFIPEQIKVKNGKIISMSTAACVQSHSGREHEINVDYENIEDIDTDCVISATGQKIEADFFRDDVDIGDKGQILVDNKRAAINKNGLFAAGDVVNGPSTVVEAIAGGREAAYSIHEYITGEKYNGFVSKSESKDNALYFHETALDISNLNELEMKTPENRTLEDEDTQGFDQEHTFIEANRCFNCGCVAVTPSDLAPALVSLNADIVTTGRIIPALSFFRANIESSTDLYLNEIVKEIRIPKKSLGNYQSYQKFRIRKTIDFPIAGLAANITVKDGKIKQAKLVLGGAAPTPCELVDVEKYIKGKEVTEPLINEVSDMAMTKAIPLKENDYKLNIFTAFVKRALSLVINDY